MQKPPFLKVSVQSTGTAIEPPPPPLSWAWVCVEGICPLPDKRLRTHIRLKPEGDTLGWR